MRGYQGRQAKAGYRPHFFPLRCMIATGAAPHDAHALYEPTNAHALASAVGSVAPNHEQRTAVKQYKKNAPLAVARVGKGGGGLPPGLPGARPGRCGPRFFAGPAYAGCTASTGAGAA